MIDTTKGYHTSSFSGGEGGMAKGTPPAFIASFSLIVVEIRPF